MNIIHVKCGFFALAILFLGGFSILAQNKSCNLQFNVYEFKEDGTAEQHPVRDAKIKLVNEKTGKSLKVGKNDGGPTVTGAIEGDYKVTISKDGFKKTLDKLSLSCESADSQNTVSEIVFLWKGDSKQTMKMYFEGIGAGTYAITESNPTKQNSEIVKKDAAAETVDEGAVLLARPEYPRAARFVKASGKVEVLVTINELGYVVSAKGVSGHPLLQSAAVEAAKKSKFRQTTLSGIPVKVTGIIVYNFVSP